MADRTGAQVCKDARDAKRAALVASYAKRGPIPTGKGTTGKAEPPK